MKTPDEAREIARAAQARVDAATPLPWHEDGPDIWNDVYDPRATWDPETGRFELMRGGMIVDRDRDPIARRIVRPQDQSFLVNARTDVPRLAALVNELADRLDAVEDDRERLRIEVGRLLDEARRAQNERRVVDELIEHDRRERLVEQFIGGFPGGLVANDELARMAARVAELEADIEHLAECEGGWECSRCHRIEAAAYKRVAARALVGEEGERDEH
jgi:hypothetical protein